MLDQVFLLQERVLLVHTTLTVVPVFELVFEDLAHVLGVEGQVKVSVDDLGDAVGSPQFVGPAVGGSAVEEQVFQVLELVVAQAGRRPRMGLGGQAVGARAGRLAPAVEGGAGDAQDAGDVAGGFALVHEFDGVATPAFEFCGGSKRSAHA